MHMASPCQCGSIARSWRTAKAKVGLALLLLAVMLVCWPVDMLDVRPAPSPGADKAAPVKDASPPSASPPQGFFLRAPLALGQGFATRYVHSVQRTPVVDEYRVVNGRIWSWREYVQSHNAGLPFAAPAQGRFWVAPPWMVVEGGRQSWPQILLRVGTDALGRNQLVVQATRHDLYTMIPGQRLELSVQRRPVWHIFRP